jgi:hypothetical protein
MRQHLKSRLGRLGSLILAVLAVGTTAIAVPAHASSDTPLSDVAMESAALQMAVDFKLDPTEARHRISVQTDLSGIPDAAARFLDSTFAGSYFDISGDGALVITGTDSGALNRFLDNLGAPTNVRAEEVKFSRDELSGSIRKAALQLLKDHSIDVIAMMVNTESNRLEVSVDEKLAQQVKTLMVGMAEEVIVVADKPRLADVCNTTLGALGCSSPMRGGIYIIGAGSSACSSGFMVHSASDGLPYVLTAAHCIRSVGDTQGFSGMRNDGFTAGIGFAHNRYYNATLGRDSGIIHVTNPYWGNGLNWTVYVMSGTYVVNGVTYTTGTNQSYSIAPTPGNSDQIPNTPSGKYLCKTGTSSGTTCGPYLGSEIGTFYRRVRYKVCSGDSGAPVYIQNRGYGIHSESVRAGGCTDVSNAGEYGLYEDLYFAMADLGVVLN